MRTSVHFLLVTRRSCVFLENQRKQNIKDLKAFRNQSFYSLNKLANLKNGEVFELEVREFAREPSANNFLIG